MNIYVGNLNYRVKESDLQKAMEDYGTVSSVKFINDRTTGRFRGIAFVEMEDDAAAAKAITDRAYLLFEGKILFQGTPEELAENKIVREKYLSNSFVLRRKDFMK